MLFRQASASKGLSVTFIPSSCLLVLLLCTLRKSFIKRFNSMRFQVLTAASMKMKSFWDIEQCSLVGVDRRFRSAYCPIIRVITLKRRSTPTRLHSRISQKALIFILMVFQVRPGIYFFSTAASRSAVGPTRCVLSIRFLGTFPGWCFGRGVNLTTPSSAEVENAWSYISSLPCVS
jgi:hypothetical protein